MAANQALSASIASAVKLLKTRQSQTTTLLEQSIELTDQTIRFLHRLVAPDDLSRVNRAFFDFNAYVSVGYFLATVADLLISST